MIQGNRPVDVISVCSAEGEIRPLRLRIVGEEQEATRVDILEILSVKEIPYTGIEGTVYLCRAVAWEREWVFELKYTIRSHNWCILRRIG